MSVINNGLLLASGADAATTYQISRSIRLNSADSAYFSRTPGSAGNRKTFTLSLWLKRTKFADNQAVFAAGDLNGVGASLRFNTSDQLAFAMAGATIMIQTTQVFRDPSAWYHIVLSFDTTQATAANRMRLYVNGTEVTAFASATYPTQNTDHSVNSTSAHQIGREDQAGTFGQYFNGYIADIYLLDGTATTPSTFAQTDATTGQWVPKTPTSISYGTNGFRLPFSDNSGTTSTTLGKDSAGSNNWTPNNFSVASGSGNDSLVDSPTSYGTDTGVGGEVRGNYCTLNAIDDKKGAAPSNGNLELAGTASCKGTFGVSTGKWYFEFVVTSISGTPMIGIATEDTKGDLTGGSAFFLYRGSDGQKQTTSGASSYGVSYTSGDVIGIAFNADSSQVTFYKNNTSQGAISVTSGNTYFPMVVQSTGGTYTFNFGQRAFAYTAPSGFKALCDTNLTAPTIAKPATYFDVITWVGTSDTNSTRSFSSLSFNPDFVWIKDRTDANQHTLYDAVRGPSDGTTSKALMSNSTNAEGTLNDNSTYGYLSSFDTNGFSVWRGSDGAFVDRNNNGYVAWAWDAASSNSTNTSGTITSTVRANATAGFSIVTYTGTGSAGTVRHGLNVPPQLILIKDRDSSTNGGAVYHASIGNTKFLKLFQTTTGSDGEATDSTMWNNTTPTSSVFSIGTSVRTNANNDKYVAYCFAPVAGYSSFGSYTGNGSSDGPFVYTGFRPRWILLKCSSTTGAWILHDTARSTYNVMGNELRPDDSTGEYAVDRFDLLSNGFKVRSTNATLNTSSTTYIYMALAESPFAYSRAR